MLGKTHMAVGVAASLLLLQPRTLPELILGAGTAAVGSVISDIDCGSSESSRRSGSDYICTGNHCHWHCGGGGALASGTLSEADEQQFRQPRCPGLRRLSGGLRLWKEDTAPFLFTFLSGRRIADELRGRIPADAGAIFWDCLCLPSGTGFSES